MPPTIDMLDHAFRANPYDTYALLRAKHPACRMNPGGLWALSRYEDVRTALKDHHTFSSKGFSFILKPGWLSDSPQSESMLAMDPPQHTRLRAVVNKAFTPKVLNTLSDYMENEARHLVRQLVLKDDIELLADFNFPYICAVVSRIVGFDASMHSEIREWIDLLNYLGPEKPPPDIHAALESRQASISCYARQVISERRISPCGDLISHVVNTDVDGETLSERECLSMLELLIGASFDTSNVLLTNCIRQLSAFPYLVKELYEKPELIPAFIEEVMRFDPPTHALLRQTAQAVDIAGAHIPAGEFVYLMLGSAGRDERHYVHAEVFDLHRQDRDHLSFGYGIHVCVGMMLARMEVKLAVEQFVKVFSTVRCPAPEDIEWANGLTSRGVVALPLHLQARARDRLDCPNPGGAGAAPLPDRVGP